ncbi:hypothetical protein COW99_01230 [Candidatus Roizmanbacteria bacterium CG22_combo_CG10-13_8_21_14_all_38_20]|uniref:Uncharacterized protein n=1 Tax=Candidatus Roizmanbacteria bacterium CG22_combo_CG10-13_8_21_14_all_38_20 TaxID=1974862 RepID=A0A2H0BWF4_9BACT|nr:type 4a pilus biogenesis protein PilO [Candidatus Microgenomates bacterium]PIP62005.1 MAG: hypothetical protein COW99_01230 [Candidatus Roizmanbacteria bacterium CG22_combo_CG10-13_8_21_14_all_38_20]PJC31336.1 MAG: hypothetical protein CO050_03665 [Candidatus Roizmanbacteria bacterium CG_4_9_14_0_2_um_filter_38_17]
MSTLVNKIELKMPRIPYYKLRKSFQSKHKHAYMMLILSLFTMSFFGLFALRPTLVTIATLNRQIKDSREIDRRLTEKLNVLVQAQAEYEVIAPFLSKINQAIPEYPEYTELLADLEEIREASGSAVSKLGIGTVEIKSSIPGQVDLAVASEGGYLSLEDFINLLLTNERLLTINSLGFNSKEENVLDLSMDVNAPYTLLKDQKPQQPTNEDETLPIEGDIIK